MGWPGEIVLRDYMQTTADGKYEYRVEIINPFQRNGYVRLYVKELTTAEETIILLDIPIKDKAVIVGGEDYVTPGPNDLPVWSALEPTSSPSVYVLTTTGMFDREKVYSFLIDMESKTSCSP